MEGSNSLSTWLGRSSGGSSPEPMGRSLVPGPEGQISEEEVPESRAAGTKAKLGQSL